MKAATACPPLVAWRARAERNRLHGWFLQQPWGQMRVWQIGQGPVLVALHGLGGSGRYWRGLAQSSAGYTIVAPDLAGFGQSSKPDVRYDLELHLASLDVLIDRLPSSQKVTLVGHSIGGIVAAVWAARHPGRVASLALVATPFPGLHPLPPPLRWVRAKPRSLSRRIPVTAVRAAIYPILFPIALLRGYGLSNVRDFTRQSLAARTGTAWSLMADTTTANQLLPLKELPPTVNTVLLTGSADRLVTARDTSEWAALLSTSDRLSRDGGHQLLLRGGFATIGDWLTKHAP